MAYTSTPVSSTYKTHRFSFVGSPQARNGLIRGKDQRFVNFFPELIKSKVSDGKKYYLKQRAGTFFRSGTTPGLGRGCYFYNGSFYSVVGASLYRDGVPVQVLASSVGTVGFTEYNGTYDALIVLDGTNGYVVKKSDNSVTKITDAFFPSPHNTHAAYLNGRLYISKKDTADIHNSALEDPLVWPSDGFITAEMFPDTVVALVRNNNYINAIGTQTIEFFYDAAIELGSPLARQDAAVQQVGSPAPDSVVETNDDTIFIGQTANGGRTVWVMNGFKPTEIGLEPVRQSLDGEAQYIVNARAYCIRSMGHKFYVLQLTARTWVYDFDEAMWHEWSDTMNDTSPFPYYYASDGPEGLPIVQHVSNGSLFEMNPAIATDINFPIYASATSLKIDFDDMNRKTCSRFTLVCDNPNPGGSTTCTVQWSDDDYQTWSTPRTLTLNGTMPSITQLGQFRRRAFKIVYNQPYPFRLESFEMDLNTGNQ